MRINNGTRLLALAIRHLDEFVVPVPETLIQILLHLAQAGAGNRAPAVIPEQGRPSTAEIVVFFGRGPPVSQAWGDTSHDAGALNCVALL